jgi:CheY-like chemotaxis protein
MDLRLRLTRMGHTVLAIEAPGEEAIRQARALLPDISLMDIILKGDIDGVEAAAHIGDQLHIPVGYVSAYTDERTLERARRTAPSGYLRKPFDNSSIRTTLEQTLGKSG